MHSKQTRMQTGDTKRYLHGAAVLLCTVIIMLVDTLLPAPASASAPYQVTMSTHYFGGQILAAEADNLTNPNDVTFSLLNGTQLWYSITENASPSSLPVTAADPRSDLVTSQFFAWHLLPPTEALPLSWNGSYQFETLKLAASFSAPGQSVQFELTPFTYQAVLMDTLHLTMQILGDKEENDAAGLMIPDSLQQIIDTAHSMTDLTSLVNDLSKMMYASPDAKSMGEYALDCAKDFGALLSNSDEINKLSDMLWTMHGEDIPLNDVIDSLESMAGYWGRVFQLGIAIFGFVRDELLAMGSVLFEQHNPTVSLSSNPISIPTPTPSLGPTATAAPTATVQSTAPPSPLNPITEYSIPSGGNGITTGPDGNLWVMGFDNKVERVTPNGETTEFSLPPDDNGNGNLVDITTGPDGNLWFAEAYGKIGRMTPNGNLTEFPVPGIQYPSSGLTAITKGPDGNLWFGEIGTGQIGRITPDGTITQYPLPNGSHVGDITAGPDGNIWFTVMDANMIGRITPSGSVTEFPVPTDNAELIGITTGADGNLWFVEANANQIGRITPNGVITEFGTPTANSAPIDITAGPDGNLWFTESNANQIGRITPAGVITEFPVPTANSSPDYITAGPGNTVWFTEFHESQIGEMKL